MYILNLQMLEGNYAKECAKMVTGINLSMG